MAKGGAVSVLNRLIFLVIFGMIAFIGVMYVVSTNPFKAQGGQPTPVLIGQIQKQYKMETAEVTGAKIVNGQTNSALPFSSEKIQYQILVTVTAGIDMSQIKDSDISVSGETVTIKLPVPQVLRIENSGQVVTRDRQPLSGFSENINLQDAMIQAGKNDVVKSIIEQGELIQKARLYAEENLRSLVLQMGFYRNVVFVQTDPKSVTPAPNPTSVPR